MAAILIADDDTITRNLLELNLQDEGYQVIPVANGEQALAQLQEFHPDLIIADVMMPILDGYALCKACKNDPTLHQIPIILYSSSYTRDQEQQLGYDFGADRYLLKPLDPEALLTTIAEILEAPASSSGDPTELSVDEEMQRLKTYNEVLFDKLSKKMEELEQQVKRLRHSEEVLKSTQAQLIQNEKMATLGQLSAGIAHEINTPLAFMASNTNTLKRYTRDFVDLFHAVQHALQTEKPLAEVEAIKELIKKRKLEFAAEDVLELIDETLDGTERLKSIVLNLKSFCRQDQREKTYTDLNSLIKSTINIAHCELKYKATVTYDLKDIPEFRCFPQQMGQVILNLVLNASQAMEEPGTITIRSWSGAGNIHIEISDTGSGMPDEVREKIFDPFFTTKPVGLGTGLGLPISADIIRRHGGTIDVSSTVGEGTQFLITLPEDA
jgi:signal transduction histidine kinase